MNKKMFLIGGVITLFLVGGVGVSYVSNQKEIAKQEQIKQDKIAKEKKQKEDEKQKEEIEKKEEPQQSKEDEKEETQKEDIKKPSLKELREVESPEDFNVNKTDNSEKNTVRPYVDNSNTSSSKPSKNNTQNSTSNIQNEPASKPPTVTVKPQEPSYTSSGSTPGFSDNEIIKSDEENTGEYVELDGDKTQVGDM